MKKLLILGSLVLGSMQMGYAHDEGHGPKITSQGKFGGKVSSVIFKKDENNKHAEAKYIAEVTKNAKGKLNLYFYDKDNKPATLVLTDIKGSLSFKNAKTSKKEMKDIAFTPEAEGFTAQLPEEAKKAVGLEMTFTVGSDAMMVAFPKI